MTAEEVARTALGQALRDETWRLFGYRGRPTGGSVWQRFRARWRVELEDAILRETICLGVAAMLLSGAHRAPSASEVISVLVHGDGQDRLWSSYGFRSGDEARGFFVQACQVYLEASRSDWLGVLVDRLRVTELPDKKIAAAVLWGAAQVATRAADFVTTR